MTDIDPGTVYVLTEGAYSDYHILAVFSTRALAEEALAAIREDLNATDRGWMGEPRIEEYPFLNHVPDKVTKWYAKAEIWDADETIPAPTVSSQTDWPWGFWDGPVTPRAKYRWVRAPIHGDIGGRLDVSGPDRESVLKVYHDRAAWLLTEPGVRFRKEIVG